MIAPTVLYDKWIAKPEFAGLWALFIIQYSIFILFVGRPPYRLPGVAFYRLLGVAFYQLLGFAFSAFGGCFLG